MQERVLIVGVGQGLSASLAHACAGRGMRVALAARNADKLDNLARETGASVHACDASDPAQVASLFEELDAGPGAPTFVVYNAGYRHRGPVAETDPDEVMKVLKVAAYGGYLVGREAARRMLDAGRGTIAFTGASASVKGYVNSAPFAMGKFALRGLAQSMARELAPKNIHVAHFVIDGGIEQPGDPRKAERGDDGLLDPAAIADTYLHIHDQPHSAWTWEVELRPWVERF